MRLLDFARHFPPHINMHICVTSRKLALLPEFLQTNAKIFVVPVKRSYLELNSAWKIHKYVAANHISIINSFDLKELFLAAAIKTFSHFKVRIVHHSIEFLYYYNAHQKALLTFLLKLTDAVICNSGKLGGFMESFLVPEKNIEVIKNGIDTSNFTKSREDAQTWKCECGIKRDQTVLGTIANFRKEKNYPFLLRGYKILANKHPNLRLICIGGGYLLDDIKSLARSYAIEEQIIFTGYSKDIVKNLAMMDVFVLCSLREGFPNVILQAMSMGIPVLASNVGGCSEIIEHMNNGMLFPTNQLNEFTEAVELLLNDKKLGTNLGSNGKKTVVDDFSIDRMIKEYAKFFRRIRDMNVTISPKEE